MVGGESASFDVPVTLDFNAVKSVECSTDEVYGAAVVSYEWGDKVLATTVTAVPTGEEIIGGTNPIITVSTTRDQEEGDYAITITQQWTTSLNPQVTQKFITVKSPCRDGVWDPISGDQSVKIDKGESMTFTVPLTISNDLTLSTWCA